MTDDFEDRLRNHLAGRAAEVRVEPDPGAFVDQSAGRTRRRGVMAAGVAALTVVVAGAGILTGVNLGGATSATAPQGSAPTDGSRGAGAALAPAGSGAQIAPSIVFAAPYTFLFTRVSSSGVTIRAFTTGSTAIGGCGPAVACVPTTTSPPVQTCPSGADCAQPIVTPHATSGPSGPSTGPGSVASPGTAGATPVSPSGQPAGSGSAGSGTSTSDPTPTTACEPLVVELSTDRAVGTGSVSLPSTASPSPSTVEVLGTGSFGTAEGTPVGWVAVWVGSGVASVQLSVGGVTADSMAPEGGVVVLAALGDVALTGGSVVGLDGSGATVGSVPVGQAATPDGASGCPAPVSTPPVTPTTPTTPVTPATTTTTTVPGGPAPAPTTTVNGGPVTVPPAG